jgi:hypothetical protein
MASVEGSRLFLGLFKQNFNYLGYTVCPGSVRTFFIICPGMPSVGKCGIKILEVSGLTVYNFKAQSSLRHVLWPSENGG